jgi:hypothetical protein
VSQKECDDAQEGLKTATYNLGQAQGDADKRKRELEDCEEALGTARIAVEEASRVYGMAQRETQEAQSAVDHAPNDIERGKRVEDLNTAQKKEAGILYDLEKAKTKSGDALLAKNRAQYDYDEAVGDVKRKEELCEAYRKVIRANC